MEWNGDILYVCKEGDRFTVFMPVPGHTGRWREACSPPVRSFVAPFRRSLACFQSCKRNILKMNESVVMEVDTIGRLDGVGHETVNVGGHKVKVKVTQG